MACLGSVLYDPAVAVAKATSALLAMTALDTTNARITFTAPANGTVMVRIRVPVAGAATQPAILLGVLDGATIRGRQAPTQIRSAGSAAFAAQREAVFLVPGLTPGNSYTWDAAYAVQVLVAASAISYGGPNDATSGNAYGALSFEVWDTPTLLAGTLYDPAVAVTSHTTAAAAAMAAIDTTNLRLTFTPPASGRVLVRLRVPETGSTSVLGMQLGVMSGASVVGRSMAYCCSPGGAGTDLSVCQSEFVVAGLAGSQTWDAAFGCEAAVASSKIAYGGPDDAAGADAFGGFAFEIWSA